MTVPTEQQIDALIASLQALRPVKVEAKEKPVTKSELTDKRIRTWWNKKYPLG